MLGGIARGLKLYNEKIDILKTYEEAIVVESFGSMKSIKNSQYKK